MDMLQANFVIPCFELQAFRKMPKCDAPNILVSLLFYVFNLHATRLIKQSEHVQC